MALDSSYASVQQYRDARGLLDSEDDVTLKRQLAAISRFLERSLEMNFNKVEEAEARLVVPPADPLGYSLSVITINPIYSTTDLEVIVDTDADGDFSDEVEVDGAYYRLLPLDAPSRNEPWTQLEAVSWGSQLYWPHSKALQITALWGWAEVPTPIVEATIELTAIWRMDSARSSGRMTELGQVMTSSRAAQQIVGDLIAAYDVYPIGIG